MKLEEQIKKITGASRVLPVECVQELWSGYGSIMRYRLEGASYQQIIVKQVSLEKAKNHPRGWAGERSHQRKLKSYEVEQEWYRNFQAEWHEDFWYPRCLGMSEGQGGVAIILEDLDELGFSERLDSASWDNAKPCIAWLAAFHARFMGCRPQGLWPTGTYWHLATRPDELDALADQELKKVAGLMDAALSQCEFQTIVHGDSKIANFCFHKDEPRVAAVDFQYVGGGCGMKDLAYFIGSALSEEDSEHLETQILDFYFWQLESFLRKFNPDIHPSAVEDSWRPLYPIAWTDFHRFLKGWSPGHWKINSYSEKLARSVIRNFQESP